MVPISRPPARPLGLSGLCHQIVDLPAPEHLPKESIVLILFPQGGVFLFEPVIAPSQTFIIPVQLSICLIEPVIAVLHLEIPHQEAFYELFQPIYQRLRKVALQKLLEKNKKKSQLTPMKREAGSFVNASYTGFTTKPPGTIPSVAKHLFGKACCKSVAKTDWKNITNPQTLENKGFAGTCQPRVIIPIRSQKM